MSEAEPKNGFDAIVEFYQKKAIYEQGECFVFDVVDSNGKLKEGARKVKLFNADPFVLKDGQYVEPDTLSSSFSYDYVIRIKTTTQYGNMRDGNLVDEGAEPVPASAEMHRVEKDGTVDRELIACSYNQARKRWEAHPN
jgi:hypothetical protein